MDLRQRGGIFVLVLLLLSVSFFTWNYTAYVVYDRTDRVLVSPPLLPEVDRADQVTPWVRSDANPVLEAGPEGSWEQVGVYTPRLLKYADGTVYRDSQGRYFLYYNGMDYDYDSAGKGHISLDQVGLAWSSDLVSWERYGDEPVVSVGGTVGDYDYGDTQVGTVLFDGGVFKMWYNANARRKLQGGDFVTFAYAESLDGVTWEKRSSPVLTQGSGGDAADLYAPIVLKDEGEWKMWYVGHDQNVGGVYRLMFATSPDGIIWTRYSDSYVFDPGYNLFPSEVFVRDGVYHLLYVNWNPAVEPVEVHLATSPDGIVWTPQGTVFRVAPEGSWDDDLVYWPTQGEVRGTWYTFYAGVNEHVPSWSIGVATSAGRLPKENVFL